MRKSYTTVAEARNEMKARYRRGSKRTRKATSEQNLSEFDRALKRELACHYKASSFSYTYIADALGLTRDIVKKWFQEPEMQERAAKLVDDMVSAAVKFGQTHAFEMMEMLAEIARTTADDRVAIQAITEYLDRIGLTKVNKSESKSASTIREEHEVNLVDKSGIIEALAENAPPEVLQRAATLMDELFSITAEHTDRDITHADA
jgi:hypothetical protein